MTTKSCGARTLPAHASRLLVKDMCVTQVLIPRHLLPCPFDVQGILQATPPSSVDRGEQLCLPLRCVQTSSYSRGIGDFFIMFVLVRCRDSSPRLRSLDQRLTGRGAPVRQRLRPLSWCCGSLIVIEGLQEGCCKAFEQNVKACKKRWCGH